jgi:predicted acyl esterase
LTSPWQIHSAQVFACAAPVARKSAATPVRRVFFTNTSDQPTDYLGDVLAHPLSDSFYQDRTPDLSKIEYPALVIANWGGLGLHLRGTIRGYMGIASREKWLKIQSGSYFHRFFDRYLKGIDNDWENEPPVEVEIRSPGDTVKRVARSTAWPLPEAQWTLFS